MTLATREVKVRFSAVFLLPLSQSLASPGHDSYLYMDASLKTEQQRARLISPVVAADTGPLCLLFSYQLWGEAQGHLRVLLRDVHNEESVLWTLKDDQGPVWKEGRTILPRSPKDFQVVMNLLFLIDVGRNSIFIGMKRRKSCKSRWRRKFI